MPRKDSSVVVVPPCDCVPSSEGRLLPAPLVFSDDEPWEPIAPDAEITCWKCGEAHFTDDPCAAARGVLIALRASLALLGGIALLWAVGVIR